MIRTLTLLFLIGFVQTSQPVASSVNPPKPDLREAIKPVIKFAKDIFNENQETFEKIEKAAKDLYKENEETFKKIAKAVTDLYNENQSSLEKVAKEAKDLYNENQATFNKIAKEKIESSAKQFFKKNKATFKEVGKAASVEVRKVVELVARKLLAQLVSGVRGVASIARMVSAISSAVETLILVLLKNIVGFTIPSQIFNLLQIVLYLVF